MSIAETRAMLDFCADHGIVADVELIGISALEGAFDRMQRGDIQCRFVIDINGATGFSAATVAHD